MALNSIEQIHENASGDAYHCSDSTISEGNCQGPVVSSCFSEMATAFALLFSVFSTIYSLNR